MAKKTTIFECQHCGYTSTKYLGKCPNCGGWDSLVELKKDQIDFLKSSNKSSTTPKGAISITEVKDTQIERFPSGEDEFDLVLGGGIVPGSLVLVGGSPGVGKSTLLLKVASKISNENQKVLYVSGEESDSQIKERAKRLGSLNSNLMLLTEINLENVIDEIDKDNYKTIIIDSIQTLYSDKISSAPGTVSQVREITFDLMRIAKDRNIAIFIIGHITKEGSIAGPRVLEHMVDTVLYFEGDSAKELRILRGFKNRFGPTSEIGIFQMNQSGLVSAKSMLSSFIGIKKPKEGAAITVVLEGTRAILIEVQALVSQSGYGYPKRSATGFEQNRLNMLVALLEKKLDLPLNEYDIFINIAGGIKINETSADLAIIAAILSSFRRRPLSHETLFIGEVSLVGDVREVYGLEQKIKEAEGHGLNKVILPKKPKFKTKMKFFEVDEVSKILEWM
ncbi:MAG: DNA repair protein RadA [Campylobacterales bacterium]